MVLFKVVIKSDWFFWGCSLLNIVEGIIDMLVVYGVDLYIFCGVKKVLVLYYVVFMGDLIIVCYFICKGVWIDVIDRDGWIVLDWVKDNK